MNASQNAAICTCIERSSDRVTMQQKSPHAVIDNKVLKLFTCLCKSKTSNQQMFNAPHWRLTVVFWL